MFARKMEGKVIIVTGGASGIGEATARAFAENGCKVALLDIDGPRLERVLEEIKEFQKDCVGVCGDVTEEDAVVSFFGKLCKDGVSLMF